ncbi:MAG: NAD-dependent DNA ligase LigA [Planctomycetia bacterium]|nr:NAD-dependent DNA ligase LigA [Planctomycetia bacterium]
MTDSRSPISDNFFESLSVEERILRLREEIKYYNHKYYNESISEISDREFDELLSELQELEERYPEFSTPDSPTQRVGGNVTDEKLAVFHRTPMLSIENAKTEGDVWKFAEKVQKELSETEKPQWVLELKIDGVAVSVIYKNGILVQGITRGDGRKGDNITENVRTIHDIPLRLTPTPGAPPIPETLEVRGEIYMTNSGLAHWNELQKEKINNGENGEIFANPRNAASGSIKQKSARECARRPLRMFCHSAGNLSGLPFQTHTEFLEALRLWGFSITPDVKVFSDIHDAVNYGKERLENAYEYDFEIDGMVLKVNDFAQRNKIGFTSKYPKWEIALKFKKYEAVTQLLDISVQVGKTGAITPVAELAPVQLAGTTVSRSSLHNADEIRRKDIRIGDWVVVEKAGKIIPHVVRVELHLRDRELPVYQFPSVCPVCSEPLQQEDGEVFIRCVNRHCPAQLTEKIRFFGSRSAMNIKGLGDRLATQLVEKGYIKNFADIYSLEEKYKRGEITGIERFSPENKKTKKNTLTNTAARINFSDETKNGETKNSESVNYARNISETLQESSFQQNIFDFFNEENPIPEAEDSEKNHKNITDPKRAINSAPPITVTIPRMAENLFAEITASKNRGLSRVLTALSIPHLGEESAALLAEHFRSMKNLLAVNAEELAAVDGIGPIIAQSVWNYLHSEEGENQITALTDAGVFMEFIDEYGLFTNLSQEHHNTAHDDTSEKPLAGKVIVVTGKMEHYAREELEILIKKSGGKATSSVSSKTDFVVAGADAGSNKLIRAQELNIPVLTEEEFQKLLFPETQETQKNHGT